MSNVVSTYIGGDSFSVTALWEEMQTGIAGDSRCTLKDDCEGMAVRVIAINFRSSFAARRLARNFSRATGIALHRFLELEDTEGKPYPSTG